MLLIPNGTEVLLFEENNTDPRKYIRGVIKECNVVDEDHLFMGFYKILCEDGNMYTAMHRSSLYGYPYFRTYKEQVDELERMINRKYAEIDELEEQIDTKYKEADELSEYMDDFKENEYKIVRKLLY